MLYKTHERDGSMINFLIDGNITGLRIMTVILVVIYYNLVMALASNILEGAKLKGIKVLPLSIFNALAICVFIKTPSACDSIFYLLAFLMFAIEFYVFHKETIMRVVFIALAFTIHILTMRAICVGVLSLILKVSYFSITDRPETFWLSIAMTAIILNIAIVLVIRFIPSTKIKIVVQHKEQLKFMALFLATNCMYMVFNARVYSINETHSFLNEIQIIASATILIGTYIILYYSFQTNELLGYKDKNQVLELEIQKEHQFRESMLTESIVNYEFNITKNEPIMGFDDIMESMGEQGDKSYNQMLILMAQRLVHSDDLIAFIEQANVEKMLEDFNKGVSEASFEYRRKSLTGEYVWVRSITNLAKDAQTGDVRAFTYVRDIDKEKKARIELEYNAERDALTGLHNKAITKKLISKYMMEMHDADFGGVLFMIDIDNFKNINDSLGHIYGDAVLRELSEKLNRCFKDIDIIGRIGGDEFMVFLKGSFHKKKIEEKAAEICKSFHNYYQGDGKTEYEISASVGVAVFPQHGDTFEELYKKADIAMYISKNKGKNTYSIYEGEKFIEYKSTRDDYDDITSTMSFKKFSENATEILQEKSDKKYILVVLDINDFKAINGIYGFDEGDKILKLMAKSIGITVKKDEPFARMSNDKFVVLTEYTEEKEIYNQGEQFRQNFYNLENASAKDHSITFSIGFSIIAKGDTDILSIIEKTMVAHSNAKRSNIGMLCYSDNLMESENKQKKLESSMLLALENNEFVVLLQPRHQISTGKIQGAEALVRWTDSLGILIPPSEFISVFEADGFIVQLDFYVFEQICKLQKTYLDKGITPLPISVNHSKITIAVPNYVKRLEKLVKKYNISSSIVEIELTEEVAFCKTAEFKKTLMEIKKAGFKISIDNFGRNYSSLTMLQDTGANTLKIDREFLRKAYNDKRGEIVLSSVIHLAKELLISVVAVGVETEEQKQMLNAQGCELAQGYFYNKPLLITEFNRLYNH